MLMTGPIRMTIQFQARLITLSQKAVWNRKGTEDCKLSAYKVKKTKKDFKRIKILEKVFNMPQKTVLDLAVYQ